MTADGIDRRAFFTRLGGAAAVATLSTSALADELEEEQLRRLETRVDTAVTEAPRRPQRAKIRRGSGTVFDQLRNPELDELPDRPTLVDFFKRRFSEGIVQHCLRSAHHALEDGQDEQHIMAALVHDTIMTLMRADHGYWGADLLAPYVDERIAWGIRYHQALRFFPDADYGYEYPELYVRMFGEDFEPEPYVKEGPPYCTQTSLVCPCAYDHCQRHLRFRRERQPVA